MQRRSTSIAAAFDRVCQVLESLDYLDGDTVTADGDRLRERMARDGYLLLRGLLPSDDVGAVFDGVAAAADKAALFKTFTKVWAQRTEDNRYALVYNHSAGIGDPAPIPYVRAAMLSRVNVHARGHSGCRAEIPLTIIEMLDVPDHLKPQEEDE